MAVLAVESEAETFAVCSYQVVGFPVRGMSLLIRRTPAHAVTQAMFAEHEYGFGYGLLLVCRFHGSYSVSLIKAAGGGIHHIAQIGQGCCRETVAGGFPHVQLTTVSNAAGGSQLVYRLATPVGYHRGGYEPVLRQVDCNGGSCCCRGAVRAAERHDLERSIPQFAELGAQVLRLRSTRKFFWIGERQGYAVAVFVRRCQGKARRGICQLPSNADFTFGGLAGKDALKFLVEIAEKTGARFDTGHIACRIQLVAIHPIDTET